MAIKKSKIIQIVVYTLFQPIGNLKDITLRALDVLSVSNIIREDTYIKKIIISL